MGRLGKYSSLIIQFRTFFKRAVPLKGESKDLHRLIEKACGFADLEVSLEFFRGGGKC